MVSFHRLALTTLVALSLVAAAGARAQDAWTLTTADFRNASVSLKGIDGNSVRVSESGQGDRTVPMDDFLQLERPLPASAQQGKFVLHMAGGDQLAGEPVSIAGEQLVWNNAAAGELRVPMSRVAAMTRPGQQPPDKRSNEDVVTLSNGDAVRGIIAGIEAGKVNVQRPDATEPTPVPLDSVAKIQFASTATPGGAAAAARSFRIRLADGSSLPARGLTLENGKLQADLGDGKPRPVDLARVAAIEQVNGPAAWLSARAPAESVYLPYFGSGQEYPARMDATVEGSRDLRFGGKTFRRAIGVHAYSKLTWPLDGSYAAFRTQYAVDERLSQADMTVRIKLGDKVVHEKQNVRGGTLSPVITVDLAGAKSLTLEVDYGSGTDVQDRLVWLEPALLKKKPAEEPPPAPATAPSPAPAPSPAAAPAPAKS
jgi:hypothetical protein